MFLDEASVLSRLRDGCEGQVEAATRKTMERIRYLISLLLALLAFP